MAMLLGRASAADVVDRARHPNAQRRRENECIAYFFLAQRQLIKGHAASAGGLFRKVLETGITHFRQYEVAKVELARLAKSR